MEVSLLRRGVDVARVTPLDLTSAVAADLPLCTGNIKHFRTIAELRLSAFRPT